MWLSLWLLFSLLLISKDTNVMAGVEWGWLVITTQCGIPVWKGRCGWSGSLYLCGRVGVDDVVNTIPVWKGRCGWCGKHYICVEVKVWMMW